MSAKIPCDPQSMKTPGLFIGLTVLARLAWEEMTLIPNACEFLGQLHEYNISSVIIDAGDNPDRSEIAQALIAGCSPQAVFRGYIVAPSVSGKDKFQQLVHDVGRTFPGLDIPGSLLLATDVERSFAHAAGIHTVILHQENSLQPLGNLIPFILRDLKTSVNA